MTVHAEKGATCPLDSENLEMPEQESTRAPSSSGFTLREIQEGTILEFDVSLGEDPYNDADSYNYIFDEDLLKSLRSNYIGPQSDESSEEDDLSNFERLMKKMNPLTEDRGVLKWIKRESSGPVVPPGALVTFHVDSYLNDSDEPFDSTRLRRRPYKLQLEEGAVVQGLYIGIMSMKAGEVAHFLVEPAYAYGRMGCPPRIPPEATILFEVEIVHVIDNRAAVEFENLDEEIRRTSPFPKVYKVAVAHHRTANDYFKTEQIGLALRSYQKAARMLEDVRLKDGEEEEKQQALLLKLYLNIALCHERRGDWDKAIVSAKNALRIDRNNTKGLFRLGKALINNKDYIVAKRCLVQANRNEPHNQEITQELKRLATEENEYYNKRKEFGARLLPMLGGKTTDETVPKSKAAMPSDDAPVSSAFKGKIRYSLDSFQTSEQLSTSFETGFTNNEIAFIQESCKELNFHSEIVGTGTKKQVKVMKKV